MTTSTIKIEGLRELALAGRKLQDEMQRKIVGNALVAGGRLIRDAARRSAPILRRRDPRRQPGTLRDAIRAVRVKKGDYPEEVMSIIGVRLLTKASIRKFKEQTGKAGAANPRDPYYWWFIEKGTRGHIRRRKAIAGVRFLKNAFESQAGAAVYKFKTVASRRIYKYGNTLAK